LQLRVGLGGRTGGTVAVIFTRCSHTIVQIHY